MPKLKKPVHFETTFGVYVVNEQLGEGGAGRVFGGKGPDGEPIALKVLSEDKVSTETKRRFKNEIHFLMQNKHPNVVTVIDHGVVRDSTISGPFYVMRRYSSTLRLLMRERISPERVLPLFSQMLDGVEALHLKGVAHRDLKPENLLYDAASGTLAVADLGIAKFTEEFLLTAVKTTPENRLANFQYAAPEQRDKGATVGLAADLFALGSILNELFTGAIPHGTGYRRIGEVFEGQSFLDDIVDMMIRQTPQDRPKSIAEVKHLISIRHADAVALQKISRIDDTVIGIDDIDDPLALEPPNLVSFAWDGRRLELILDRKVSVNWVDSLHGIGSYSSLLGLGPETFDFHENRAFVDARENQIQPVIDHFKTWLPVATAALREEIEQFARRRAIKRREQLKSERELEEQKLRVLRNVKV